MTRKEFFNRVALFFGAVVLPPFPLSASSSSPSLESGRKASRKTTKALDELTAARHKARWRFRRIICNNDGNDTVLAEGEVVSRELFLAKRTMGLAGSQVDTVCYCTGVTFGGHHNGKNRLLRKSGGRTRCAEGFDEMGTDSLALMVDYCHQHNIEVFWSHRMNDRHDSAPSPELVTDFKKQHPEYLIGAKNEITFDYSHEAVRNKLLECCEEVAANYDVDGIELDWFRHLRLFKSVVEGGVASEEELGMINDMMRKLRSILDDEGLKRGRPFLLAVRVPDSREYARLCGIDYEQWLKEDLVDVLVVNDYIKLEPWANFPEFAKKYNVPAYASMERRRVSFMDSGSSADMLANAMKKGEDEDRRFRSEAYAAWLSGMNGIYTFNRFIPQDELFRQIGDPRVLAQMDVTPRETYGLREMVKGLAYCSVNFWLHDGDKYLKIPSKHKYVKPCPNCGWPNSTSKPEKA